MKIIKQFFGFFVLALLSPVILYAQSSEIFTVTEAALKGDLPVELGKLQWKYRAGDDAAWAARDFDDAAWETIEGSTVNAELLGRADWRGEAWFRLRFKIEDKVANQNIVLSVKQRGAAEFFIDGKPLAKFGEITDAGITEYNPNYLPIPFRLDDGSEHSIAVHFASSAFREASGWQAKWLTDAGISPGISPAFLDGNDLTVTIGLYANYASMRGGFLFVGILLSLALLHLLLYLFYRVESANFFYSIYAASYAFYLLISNFRNFGHLGVMPSITAAFIASLLLAASYTGLLGFVHVAFGRRLGIIFWTMTALWTIVVTLNFAFLNRSSILQWLPNVLIALSFTFSIYRLVAALREKRGGAWILMVGLQIFAVVMFLTFMGQIKALTLPQEFYSFAEITLPLAIPVAVSLFLARNFASTNRDLKTQLIQVEQLSQEKIEQERQAVELRAENQRRAKELEEARQLQLSMLPKQLPQIANLEIAAYMKPATEVGGDYYDFYVGDDGTLTVAVGDATGHGLKAGTVVTATKGLFNNLAHEPDITNIFRQTSSALKRMNLRGLFMAMAMLKIKNNRVILSSAGMPAVLIYRDAAKTVEEILIKAMPLGSISNFPYRDQQFDLSRGDCVVVMSDGFPEMFNTENEMIGFEKAAAILPDIAAQSPEKIISHLVKIGEDWAGIRPPDDDVTFVVLKVT
jgi:serine phosphatase RsbU (regulator of sigma subunit)